MGAFKACPAAPEVAGAYRQRYAKIDDCQIQNPAYSFARVKYERDGGKRRPSLHLNPAHSHLWTQNGTIRYISTYFLIPSARLEAARFSVPCVRFCIAAVRQRS